MAGNSGKMQARSGWRRLHLGAYAAAPVRLMSPAYSALTAAVRVSHPAGDFAGRASVAPNLTLEPSHAGRMHWGCNERNSLVLYTPCRRARQ